MNAHWHINQHPRVVFYNVLYDSPSLKALILFYTKSFLVLFLIGDTTNSTIVPLINISTSTINIYGLVTVLGMIVTVLCTV